MTEGRVDAEDVRAAIVAAGRVLDGAGMAPGTSGNISVRLGDRVLVTPTNSRLGKIRPDTLSEVDLDGNLLRGDQPSKEVRLHLAVYLVRPRATAAVHLHAPFTVALSCLDVNPEDAIAPLTGYALMRLGRVPVVAFHPPGSARLADEVASALLRSRVLLLANHGSLVAGRSLDIALGDAEELEQAARLAVTLRGAATRLVPDADRALLTQESVGRG